MMQDWFLKAKLGIFVHWGIYAVGDVSESWSFHNGVISYEDYMKQLDGFTAAHFDAKAWADLFRRSGARYAVLTTKHHDGVALFDTKGSDLSVVKKTPAARDLIAEYTEAMREAGLKVGLYFSLIDWSDERYRSIYPEGVRPEDATKDVFGSPAGGPEDPERWEAFLAFNELQMQEILNNYGKVDLIWFDGDWERSAAQWRAKEIREFLHRQNPDIVINSRLQGYGDYATPEQGIPVRAPKGPFEFCTTINESWGWRPSDLNYKSSRQCIRMFCDVISLGGNLLLDLGPKPDGTIDERYVRVLEDLGRFIRDHEEAIYETSAGIPASCYGSGSVLSSDRRALYLFLYDQPSEFICVKGLRSSIKSISVLHSGQALKWNWTGGAPWNGIPGTLWIKGDEIRMHDLATVIKLEFEDELDWIDTEGQAVTQN